MAMKRKEETGQGPTQVGGALTRGASPYGDHGPDIQGPAEKAGAEKGEGTGTGAAAKGTMPGSPGSEGSLLPAVTLPTGGGAIRGIGEKFEVNAVTGTASLSIPLPA